MITEEQLNEITARIKEKVWRNPLVMYNMDTDDEGYAIDVLSSLHNLLYECVIVIIICWIIERVKK